MNVVSPACYDQLSWLPAWIFVNKASSSSSGSGALNDHDLELLLLKEVTKHNGSRPDYHHEDHIAHIKVGGGVQCRGLVWQEEVTCGVGGGCRTVCTGVLSGLIWPKGWGSGLGS